jgi:hypothetical protein
MTPIRHVVAGDARLRDPTIHAALRRFPQHVRGAVEGVAALDARLADLAVAFPAVLFALAVPSDNADPWSGILATVEGRKLADLARIVGVPMWARRLPPEAFDKPRGPLPDGTDFALKIANHLPKPDNASAWLDAVFEAAMVADPDTALWVASLTSEIPSYTFKRTCLWVWFSRRPGTLGHRFAQADRWSPGLQTNEASVRARRWAERCDFFVDVGEDGAANGWFAPVTVDGYTFRPLTTLADVSSAARLMKNCALNYGSCIADGNARLWLVSSGPHVAAMVELRRVSGAGAPYAVIGQVRGVGNRAVPRTLQAAVYRWWSEQTEDALAPGPSPIGDLLGTPQYARYRALWRPYLAAKRRQPAWLPPAGTIVRFEDLC